MNMILAPLPDDEARKAAEWWAGRGLRPGWTQQMERHDWLADEVVKLAPDSVLEFGCAAGRNLHAIRDRLPDARLVGLDINPKTVGHGVKHWNLDLRLDPLDTLPDEEFDLAFTVSVLDHIPPDDVEPYVDQLCRVARRLLLVEPWLGRTGKVDPEVVTRTSPYSYSHDLVGMLREREWVVRYERHPLAEWGLGPWYRAIHARPRL